MAIAVDDSTVARTSTAETATTASFTPASGSFLVACVCCDFDGAITMSGGGLTWTAGSVGSNSGRAQIFTAVGAGSSMTASATAGAFTNCSLKVYIVTGQHATTPRGNQGTGTSSSDPTNFTAYTSSVDNSREFYVCTDWNASGSPTSSDTESAFHTGGTMSGLSAYKASDTTPSGSSVSGNYDPPSAPTLAWAALEVVPDAGGGGGGGGLVSRKTLLGVGKFRLGRDEWAQNENGRIYTRRAA